MPQFINILCLVYPRKVINIKQLRTKRVPNTRKREHVVYDGEW